MSKKDKGVAPLTGADLEKERELLLQFEANASALEALDAERREVMAEFRERKAGIMDSNKQVKAELDALRFPPPLEKFAKEQEAKEATA
jgi:hypothetical protein